jgi:ABC-type glycerol-3-phosphate transport system permease component
MSADTIRTLRQLSLTVLWVGIAWVYLFPYTWMILTGFRNPIDTLSLPPKFFFRPTLDGFRYIFANTGFQHYLANSSIVTASTTLLVVAVAAPAAYALAHLQMRRGTFLLAILIARMVPGVGVVIPFYLVAAKLGQLDTYHVLVTIFTAFNLPFAIWLLRSFFREITPELREAAIVDGCSEFGVFARIMLPLAMGGIAATGVFVFIAAWNEFLFALILTNSRAATAPLAILGFRTEYGTQWGAIGAAALLVSTPVIAFAIFMQKYLVRGLTMGSIR